VLAKNIRFQLTPDDYLSATLMNTHWWRTFLIVVIGGTAVVIGPKLNHAGELSSAALEVSLMSTIPYTAAATLIVLIARFFLAPRRARRYFAQNKSLLLPRTITWNEDELAADIPESVLRTPWSVFTTWRENRDLFTLYVTDGKFHILPKRAFASAADVIAFRQLIQRKIAPKPGVKRKARVEDVFA
jgi:hypothetical protein